MRIWQVLLWSELTGSTKTIEVEAASRDAAMLRAERESARQWYAADAN